MFSCLLGEQSDDGNGEIERAFYFNKKFLKDRNRQENPKLRNEMNKSHVDEDEYAKDDTNIEVGDAGKDDFQE